MLDILPSRPSQHIKTRVLFNAGSSTVADPDIMASPSMQHTKVAEAVASGGASKAEPVAQSVNACVELPSAAEHAVPAEHAEPSNALLSELPAAAHKQHQAEPGKACVPGTA